MEQVPARGQGGRSRGGGAAHGVSHTGPHLACRAEALGLSDAGRELSDAQGLGLLAQPTDPHLIGLGTETCVDPPCHSGLGPPWPPLSTQQHNWTFPTVSWKPGAGPPHTLLPTALRPRHPPLSPRPSLGPRTAQPSLQPPQAGWRREVHLPWPAGGTPPSKSPGERRLAYTKVGPPSTRSPHIDVGAPEPACPCCPAVHGSPHQLHSPLAHHTGNGGITLP